MKNNLENEKCLADNDRTVDTEVDDIMREFYSSLENNIGPDKINEFKAKLAIAKNVKYRGINRNLSGYTAKWYKRMIQKYDDREQTNNSPTEEIMKSG